MPRFNGSGRGDRHGPSGRAGRGEVALAALLVTLPIVISCAGLGARDWWPEPAATPTGEVQPATATPRPTPTDDPDAGESGGPAPSDGEASAPVARTVLQFHGSTSRTSRAFTVDASWSISWTHEGKRLFSVQVVPAAIDTYGELVVSTTARGTGRQPMYRSGEFVVRVLAADRWSVTVSDEPTRRPIGLPAKLTGSGSTNTPVFRNDGDWMIEWEQPGRSPFGLELFPLTEEEPWLLVAANGASSGCVATSIPGEHYLHVVADGRWTIVVHEVEGEAVCPVP